MKKNINKGLKKFNKLRDKSISLNKKVLENFLDSRFYDLAKKIGNAISAAEVVWKIPPNPYLKSFSSLDIKY